MGLQAKCGDGERGRRCEILGLSSVRVWVFGDPVVEWVGEMSQQVAWYGARHEVGGTGLWIDRPNVEIQDSMHLALLDVS